MSDTWSIYGFTFIFFERICSSKIHDKCAGRDGGGEEKGRRNIINFMTAASYDREESLFFK